MPFVLPLNKQALDADPKAVQQFSWKCWASRKYNIVFYSRRSKRNHFEFFARNHESIKNLF